MLACGLTKGFKNSLRVFSTYNQNVKPRVLITGALGQIGVELVRVLRERYGAENVIASDIKLPQKKFYNEGPFTYIDVTDYHTLAQAAVEYGVDWVVHNSALVSVVGEANPELAMKVNIEGTKNVLKLCKELNLRVLAPSTMGVYSPDSGKDNLPEDTILNPSTIYGISKVFLEHLGKYYTRKYGVDFRCLRYPGIISYETEPGGGTTDYAIHMFYAALTHGHYVSPLEPNEMLPMMYMSDCLKATVQLLEAPQSVLSRRVYNVAAMSFSPESLSKAIKQHLPNFKVEYQVERKYQDIASSWPNTMDDSAARRDWGWKHEVGLEELVEDMLQKVGARLNRGGNFSSTRAP